MVSLPACTTIKNEKIENDKEPTTMGDIPDELVRKFSCDQCDYQTNHSTHLKRHQLGKHDGVKYSCNQCDRQFVRKDSLKEHQSSKHEGKVYSCNFCDFTCSYSSKLSHHNTKNHK